MKATYVGESEAVNFAGFDFTRGEAVDVSELNEDMKEKLRSNSFFEVVEEAAQSEKPSGPPKAPPPGFVPPKKEK